MPVKPSLFVSGSVLHGSTVRFWRTPKRIPAGTVMEWFDHVDHHRGTGIPRKITVQSTYGFSVQDTEGDWHCWTDLKKKHSFKLTIP